MHVRCHEGGWKVSCWPLLVGLWEFLKHVWWGSGICLKHVCNVFGRCLEGVMMAQIGLLWPHLALEDIW